MSWAPDELDRIDAADELEIAVRQRWVPIWVVRVGTEVFVRTWQRRETGWYGQALTAQQARIRVPGVERAVTIDDVGPLRAAEVDAAYRTKYGRYGSATIAQMVSPDAVASTLQLIPLVNPGESGS